MFKYLPFLLILFFQLPVLAQQAAAFKDESNNLFLFGLRPNQIVEIGIKKPINKAYLADECGLIKIDGDETIDFENQVITPNFNFPIKEQPLLCTELATYPEIFRLPNGAFTGGGGFRIAIKAIPNKAYKINYPNYEVTRQIAANSCGFLTLKNVSAQKLNLPTITAERADFEFNNLPIQKPLLCSKNQLFFPVGFDSKSVANATVSQNTNSNTGSNNTGNNVTAQNSQPVAAKNGNNLIITNIPPGTYVVSNATNLSQNKTYSVGIKACLVSDRTTIGSPNNFLVSRQGLTFPVAWNNLQTVSTVPVCK